MVSTALRMCSPTPSPMDAVCNAWLSGRALIKLLQRALSKQEAFPLLPLLGLSVSPSERAVNPMSQHVAMGGRFLHVGCKQLELQPDVRHPSTVSDGVSRRDVSSHLCLQGDKAPMTPVHMALGSKEHPEVL